MQRAATVEWVPLQAEESVHVQKPTASEPKLKRAFDLFLLVASHVVLFPVFAPMWVGVPVAIWLTDRGPVFFRQQRMGRDGRPFALLKFRTMVVNADRVGPGWTSEQDPRLTAVGRMLRRFGIDELPQVINILRGDMSFVGPRALPVKMHEEATREEPRFPLRLQVRPGGTGLALLCAPRHCSARRRLRYDLIYITKAGFCLDVRILIVTAWLTLTGRWGKGFRRPEDGSRRPMPMRKSRGTRCGS